MSPQRISHWRLVTSQNYMTNEILNYKHPGNGTAEDPYRVDWIPGDPRNPLLIPEPMKWFIAVIMSFDTLAVSFASTAFSGAIPQVKDNFGLNTEVSTLTVSLFVLGFAIGPMSWAPLSELYGRQYIYFIAFALVTIFEAGSIASQSVPTLLVLRLLADSTGASAIVNSAGVISDCFAPRERGLAVMVWGSAPFLGPTLGPVVGGFLGQYGGWRWVDALTTFFCGVCWIVGTTIVPEKYAPTLLIRRAKRLSEVMGKTYKSKLEVEGGLKSSKEVFRVAMVRPWVLLLREPIVFVLAIYAAIIYGTLYLVFSAFPIVFETQRGWSQAISGLSFLGIMLGQIIGMAFAVYLDVRYKRKAASKPPGSMPPEARLEPSMIGGFFLPIGLFWFAWTNAASIHWSVCIIGSGFFGFGQVLLFISLINYIIDSYTVFAASSLAANAILRAIFGAAFPLFTTYMYENLGIHWASSVPAFLALLCAPCPLLLYKYGAIIRNRCKYSAKSSRIMAAIMSPAQPPAAQFPSPKEDLWSKEEGNLSSMAGTEHGEAENKAMENGDSV